MKVKCFTRLMILLILCFFSSHFAWAKPQDNTFSISPSSANLTLATGQSGQVQFTITSYIPVAIPYHTSIAPSALNLHPVGNGCNGVVLSPQSPSCTATFSTNGVAAPTSGQAVISVCYGSCNRGSVPFSVNFNVVSPISFIQTPPSPQQAVLGQNNPVLQLQYVVKNNLSTPVNTSANIAPGANFTITNNTCNTIAANSTCNITADFTAPNSPASISGTLTLTGTGNSSIQNTTVVNVIQPVSASTTTTFPITLPTLGSNIINYTVKNNFNQNITVGTSNFTAGFSEILNTNTCHAATLAPGATCNLPILFTASGTPGTVNGSFNITNNFGTVPLNVTGLQFITKDFVWSDQSLTGFNNAANSNVLSIVVAQDNPNVVYVATSGSGIFKTVNGGQNWFQVNNGLPTLNNNLLPINSVDAVNSNTVVAGTSGDGFYLTTNGGNTWTAFNTGLPNNSLVTSVLAVNSTTFLAAAATGLYVSQNGGAWQLTSLQSSLPIIGPLAKSQGINNNTVNVYVGVQSSNACLGIFKPIDPQFLTWQAANTGLPSNFCVNGISAPDLNTVYITGDGFLNNVVFVSTNAGAQWTDANFPNVNVSLLPIAAFDSLNVFVGDAGGSGVFLTTVGNQLPNPWFLVQANIINSFSIEAMATAGPFVAYVGTLGGGGNPGQLFKGTLQ